jgi:acetylornithine deacetylase
VEREWLGACARIASREPSVRADVSVTFAQSPSDVPVDAPIVRALAGVLRDLGDEPRVEGMTAWTDAAILNDAGIPAICFGPGDIGVAHAAEEYVSVREIERATEVLAALAARWCAARQLSANA